MKTKIAVLIGMAVCAMLLASPVLASAGYSKIYGNANEDDVLDMRDVTYIKLVIFEKKSETELCDAKYDGKISMLDVGQTKLIILGKEKELTIIDHGDRVVTIPLSIERVISADMLNGPRTMIGLGVVDKIVAINEYIGWQYGHGGHGYWSPLPKAAPWLGDLPSVGSCQDPNRELIVSLNPDIIFAATFMDIATANSLQEATGIPVVMIQSSATLDDFGMYRLMGTVMEKDKEAEELISYIEEKIAEVTEITSDISDDEKPTVYFVSHPWKPGQITRTQTIYGPIDLAGGINVAKDALPPKPGSFKVDVSKEQIIAWNPDVIMMHSPTGPPRRAVSKDDVIADPDLQTINAVKNKQVYHTKGFMCGWDPATGTTETFYMAKLIHPGKFEDVDMEKEGNEILERVYGVDGLYTEMAERCELHRWE